VTILISLHIRFDRAQCIECCESFVRFRRMHLQSNFYHITSKHAQLIPRQILLAQVCSLYNSPSESRPKIYFLLLLVPPILQSQPKWLTGTSMLKSCERQKTRSKIQGVGIW